MTVVVHWFTLPLTNADGYALGRISALLLPIDLGITTIIGQVNVKTHNPNDSVTAETTLELDSHADTCVVGNGALIINDFDQPVDVLGYDKSLGSTQYKTVSAVL